MQRSIEEIQALLRADTVDAITIGRLSAVGIGREPFATIQARELADTPKYGADGPGGECLISRAEYRELRAAGAKDETPWA